MYRGKTINAMCAEYDVKIQRFDVDLGNRSSGGSAQEPGDHPQRHHDPQPGGPHATADREIEADQAGAAGPLSLPGEGNQFDVTI